MRTLGDGSYTITTTSPRAQRHFNQGLRLYYAFNHAEGIRAFEEARLGPQWALCYAGIALSYGPNISPPMGSAAGIASWQALQRGRAVARHASARERGLIEALGERYSEPHAERAGLASA